MHRILLSAALMVPVTVSASPAFPATINTQYCWDATPTNPAACGLAAIELRADRTMTVTAPGEPPTSGTWRYDVASGELKLLAVLLGGAVNVRYRALRIGSCFQGVNRSESPFGVLTGTWSGCLQP